MLEKYLENKLRIKIKQLGVGAMCLKFESPGYTGVPDRIILLPGGKIIFAELKKLNKKERPRQEYVQACLRELGFEVYSAVDSVEKIDMITERCREVIQYGGA